MLLFLAWVRSDLLQELPLHPFQLLVLPLYCFMVLLDTRNLKLELLPFNLDFIASELDLPELLKYVLLRGLRDKDR